MRIDNKMKRIGFHNTPQSNFELFNPITLEWIGGKLNGKTELLEISPEFPMETLNKLDYIVWNPFPTELITRELFEKPSLTKGNWFERLRENGFKGKRVLYLSPGFVKDCKKEMYSPIAEEIAFYSAPNSFNELIDILNKK